VLAFARGRAFLLVSLAVLVAMLVVIVAPSAGGGVVRHDLSVDARRQRPRPFDRKGAARCRGQKTNERQCSHSNPYSRWKHQTYADARQPGQGILAMTARFGNAAGQIFGASGKMAHGAIHYVTWPRQWR